MQVRVCLWRGVGSGCVGIFVHLIKGNTCVVCCVCISSSGAVDDREMCGEWVVAQ